MFFQQSDVSDTLPSLRLNFVDERHAPLYRFGQGFARLSTSSCPDSSKYNDHSKNRPPEVVSFD